MNNVYYLSSLTPGEFDIASFNRLMFWFHNGDGTMTSVVNLCSQQKDQWCWIKPIDNQAPFGVTTGQVPVTKADALSLFNKLRSD